MNNNSFDAHVKEQLGNYRPDVPAHVWENIVAKQSKRRPVPFWFLMSRSARMAAGLAILLTAGAIAWYAFQKSDGAEERTDLVESGAPGTNSNSTGAVINKQIDKQTDIGNNKDLENNTTAKISGVNIETAQNAPENSKTLSLLRLNNNGKSRITITPSLSMEENTTMLDVKYLSRNKSSINLLPYALNKRRGLIGALPENKNIPCPDIEKDAAGNKTYIEVYAGPDINFNAYTDASNAAYMAQRQQTESALFSFSAGARYTKVFRTGMSLRAGVNYSRVSEQFRHSKGNVIHNVYMTNAAGDTTGTYTETGTRYQTATNVYQSFDIPVTAGYELGNGRLHANINAGAIINIHSTQRGYVVDPGGNAVAVSSKGNSPYSRKANAGVSLTGAVSLYYKLNDRAHILAEPYIKYGLTPVSKPELTLKQKNNAAGLRLGVRYDL